MRHSWASKADVWQLSCVKAALFLRAGGLALRISLARHLAKNESRFIRNRKLECMTLRVQPQFGWKQTDANSLDRSGHVEQASFVSYLLSLVGRQIVVCRV